MGEDNYAPVANRISLRIFLTAVPSNKWELIQADVKTAFLNADNPGRELVKLPKEVVNSEKERVRILQRALYGLQRAPKMWYLTFTEWAVGAGYSPCDGDPCWFVHSTKRQMIIIYVDDMLLAAENRVLLQEMSQSLLARFQSRIMGIPTYTVLPR